jgi:hypothetical protein
MNRTEGESCWNDYPQEKQVPDVITLGKFITE